MTCQNRKWRCDIDYDKVHVLSTSENETTMRTRERERSE